MFNSFRKKLFEGQPIINVGTVYDPLTLPFISANGITSKTIIDAINTCFIEQRAAGILNSHIAQYFLFLGSATATKFNAMNPADTDAAFRITWNGGVSYASTGATGNGSTGYGDTNIVPNTNLSQNDVSMGIYIRNNIANSGMCDMGVGAANSLYLYSRFTTGNTLSYGANETFGTNTYTPNYDSTGFYSISRASATLRKVFKNGHKLQEVNTSSSGRSTGEINIMRIGGAATDYSTREYAYAFVGTALTEDQEHTRYEIIQRMLTTLGI
jgi:hypothetical protein